MNRTLLENIDWVGYIDWNIRDFHSYETFRGATYNSYLIRDDKTVLIDTVKAPYAEYLLNRINEINDPEKIDYIVCNHAEPDHSGALPLVLKALPNATLLCNKKCSEVLAGYYDTSNWRMEIVDETSVISLGNRSLQFINTPLVHWPESMATYVPEDGLLFSMDAFGQHYATVERFDDEVENNILFEEAKTYYANIIMPFGKQVQNVLKRLDSLDIHMIAPSHGLIWRKNIPDILKEYDCWSKGLVRPKVLVIYDTMWESTALMAEAIVDGASKNGVHAKLIYIRQSNLTSVAAELIDTAAVAFGSSTLNKGMMPMAAAALTYIQGMNPPVRAGFAFGSSGWGKGGPDAVNDVMESMKWRITREPLKGRFRPDSELLCECRKAGEELAKIALAESGNEQER
jgi:flavorubredoxin